MLRLRGTVGGAGRQVCAQVFPLEKGRSDPTPRVTRVSALLALRKSARGSLLGCRATKKKAADKARGTL